MATMTRKTKQKQREKGKVVDLFELTEKRLEQAKRETKRYKDMKSFSDWDHLMKTVPGFW